MLYKKCLLQKRSGLEAVSKCKKQLDILRVQKELYWLPCRCKQSLQDTFKAGHFFYATPVVNPLDQLVKISKDISHKKITRHFSAMYNLLLTKAGVRLVQEYAQYMSTKTCPKARFELNSKSHVLKIVFFFFFIKRDHYCFSNMLTSAV